MSRVKRGVTKRARHKKILKMAKGYRGRAKNCFRIAIFPFCFLVLFFLFNVFFTFFPFA
jgi:hypothetical protein